MRTSLTILTAALLWASPSLALRSVDSCNQECDSHQLQWRVITGGTWANVANPFPLEDIVDDNDQPARGVNWDDKGISSFGEFRALSIRGVDVSPYSDPIFIDEPPVAPLMVAALGMLIVMRRVRLGARTSTMNDVAPAGRV